MTDPFFPLSPSFFFFISFLFSLFAGADSEFSSEFFNEKMLEVNKLFSSPGLPVLAVQMINMDKNFAFIEVTK